MKLKLERSIAILLALTSVILCILKVTKIISISWVLCLCPVIIPVGILAFFFMLMIIGAILIYLFTQS
jgi:hypothetical protein